jgi:AraC-like DNA-binding protein
MTDATTLPPRSTLFRVLPLGLSTGRVESLTSYVTRLAAAHLVTPLTLLRRGLAWWDAGETSRVGEWGRQRPTLRLSNCINAHASGARWCRLLERLTCIDDLSPCTMLAWADLYPDRGLLRDYMAWCPTCQGEQSEPYDPLLFCLREVKACSRHRCRLVERCAHCGSQVPVLHARSVPGGCPKCKMSRNAAELSPKPAPDEEVQVAQLAESFLLATAITPKRQWRRTCAVAEVLRRCMAASELPDAAALGRLVNVSRITAWGWLNGKSVPDFSLTLRLCHCFGLSVEDFLTGRVPESIDLRGTGELPIRPTRRRPGHRDDVGLAKAMRRYCEEHTQRPPSLAEVAEVVGVSPRVLRNRFPSACNDISRDWREFIQAQRIARQEELRRTIRDLALREKIKRGRVRRSELIKLLPKPGVLRSATTRDLVKQTLLELH